MGSRSPQASGGGLRPLSEADPGWGAGGSRPHPEAGNPVSRAKPSFHSKDCPFKWNVNLHMSQRSSDLESRLQRLKHPNRRDFRVGCWRQLGAPASASPRWGRGQSLQTPGLGVELTLPGFLMQFGQGAGILQDEAQGERGRAGGRRVSPGLYHRGKPPLCDTTLFIDGSQFLVHTTETASGYLSREDFIGKLLGSFQNLQRASRRKPRAAGWT